VKSPPKKTTHVYGNAAKNALQPDQTEPSAPRRRPLELDFQVGHGIRDVVRLLARRRKVLVIMEESLSDWKPKTALDVRNERQVLPDCGNLPERKSWLAKQQPFVDSFKTHLSKV
jgi:hypothetical protein